MDLIPYLLMAMMVVSHSVVIVVLNKKRRGIDTSTEGGMKKDKTLKGIITLLYVEMPFLVALIWFVVVPTLSAQH